MAHVLSEDSSLSLYDKGHKVFRTSFDVKKMSLPVVDFEKALESKKPKEKIQSIEPQVLYFSLKNKGLEDSRDVLPFLSQEQFKRIVDYDVWRQDEIVTKKVFSWMDAYKKIEPKQMLDRYRGLEEEYQVAALASHVRGYTEEEYERMSEAEQDSLYAFPGKEIYFSIVGLDKVTTDSIMHFFEIAGELDIEYAVSLLSHLTYAPPLETGELIARFRKARLEEDGFVTSEEARTFFENLDLKKFEDEISELHLKFSHLRENEKEITPLISSEIFLDKVLHHLKESSFKDSKRIEQNFLFLLNALVAGAEVEADDLSEIKQLMKIAHGSVSLSLEVLSKGDVSFAAYLLKEKFLKELFRFSVSYLNKIKRDFLKDLGSLGTFDIKPYLDDLDRLRYGPLLNRIDSTFADVFGFEGTELIKAFIGRFSFYPEVSDKKGSEDSPKVLLFSVISSLGHVNQIKGHLENLKILTKKTS